MKQFLSCLFLVVFSVSLMAQEKPVLIDGVKAVVGGNMILKSEVDFEVERLKEQGYENTGELYCFVWREKLFEKLLLHKADLDSVEVSDGEIDAEISRRLNYLMVQMKGSEEEFEKYFKKSVLEFKEEMRPVIKNTLMAQRMRAKISEGVTVSPKEVEVYYNTVSRDSLPIIQEQIGIAQIVIKPKANSFEEERIKKEIDEIRRKIVVDKRDFGYMATLHSDDPGSKMKGGALGLIPKEQLVPEFVAAASKLRPGEISEVVESRYGYHIIQLIEKKGTLINVRHILKVPQIYSFDIELAKKRADSVYAALVKSPDKFAELAGKVSDDELTKSNGGVLSNPQTGSSLFEPSVLPKDMFFGVQGLKKGEFAKPSLARDFQGKQVYRILKLVDKTEFHTATIEKDYDLIKKAALGKKKEKVMYDWISKYIEGTYIKMPEGMEHCGSLSAYYAYLNSKKQ